MSEKDIVAFSGGVDSLVIAILGFMALKGKLAIVFLDDGLMLQ